MGRPWPWEQSLFSSYMSLDLWILGRGMSRSLSMNASWGAKEALTQTRFDDVTQAKKVPDKLCLDNRGEILTWHCLLSRDSSELDYVLLTVASFWSHEWHLAVELWLDLWLQPRMQTHSQTALTLLSYILSSQPVHHRRTRRAIYILLPWSSSV